jgi:hypothetical protein
MAEKSLFNMNYGGTLLVFAAMGEETPTCASAEGHPWRNPLIVFICESKMVANIFY